MPRLTLDRLPRANPSLLLAALALTACELPTKLGDLTEPETSSTTEQPDGTDGASTAATAETAGSTSTSGPDDTTTSSSSSSSTSTTSTTSTTGAPPACEGLDEAACAQDPGCQTHHGVAYDFESCPSGHVYLGCSPAEPCDLVLTTICRDGTDEVYLNDNGCIPPGFSVCDSGGLDFCGGCEALDEAACLAGGDFCEPIHGAPHIQKDGLVCADFANQVFLVCVLMDGQCPPFIPTVCPVGMPDQAFDIPSGCIPPGYEQCQDAAPPCP